MSHLIVVDLITEIFWCEGFRATEDGRVIYVPPIDQAEVARIWGEGYTMSRDGSVSWILPSQRCIEGRYGCGSDYSRIFGLVPWTYHHNAPGQEHFPNGCWGCGHAIRELEAYFNYNDFFYWMPYPLENTLHTGQIGVYIVVAFYFDFGTFFKNL